MLKHYLFAKTCFLSFFFLCCCASMRAQDFVWAKNMGGPASDQGWGVATDTAGNVYVAGLFNTIGDFNIGETGGSLNAAGVGDVFVAKYNRNGTFLWVKNMGGGGSDQAQDIAVDATGNVYITGIFQSTADFNIGGTGGSVTALGSYDIFVAKYDTGGDFQWVKSFGGPRGGLAVADFGYGIAVDLKGNVFACGYFNDSVDFNPGGTPAKLKVMPGTGATTSSDAFVIKYDANGSFQWVRSMGGPTGDAAHDVATDDAGNVVVTGYYNGKAAFAPGDTLTAVASSDIFVAKYDSSGNLLWAKSAGGSSAEQGWGTATDKAGNVYAMGYFGSADFNPGAGNTLVTAGGNDVYLIKYDPDGNYLWANRMGGPGAEIGRSVALDQAGNSYITGIFNQTADFNPGGNDGSLTATTSTTANDIFIAKYDPDGNFFWAKQMGGTGNDQSLDIAVDLWGNVYNTGSFNNTADFNPGADSFILTPEGMADAFIAKLGCADTVTVYFEDSVVCGTVYTFNSETYTESGSYAQHFPNISGCDSTVILDLVFFDIKPDISVNEFELSVVGTYATYQWIKNGKDIPGATGPTYTVTENANYQVRVTDENGCTGTSDVYPVTNVPDVSVNSINDGNKHIAIYPNPAKDIIEVKSPVSVTIALYNIEGRMIKVIENTKQVHLKELQDGLYLFRVYDAAGNLLKSEKVIKQ